MKKILYASLVILLLFGGALGFRTWNKQAAESPAGLYFATFWSLVFMAGALVMAWQSAINNDRTDWNLFTRHVLSGVCGAVLGVGLGIFFFPLSTQEQTQFGEIRSVVGALIAGVVGARLLDIWRYLTHVEENGVSVPKLFQPKYAIAAGLFIASLGLGFVTQYAARYWHEAKVIITALPNQKGLKKAADNSTYFVEDGAFHVILGQSVRFAAAATTPNNIAVHWRMEAADDATDIKNIELDDYGLLKTDLLSKAAKQHAKLKLIASSDGDPTAAAVVIVAIDGEPETEASRAHAEQVVPKRPMENSKPAREKAEQKASEATPISKVIK